MDGTQEDNNIDLFALDGAVIRNNCGDQLELGLDELLGRTVGSIEQELNDPESLLHKEMTSRWSKDPADMGLTVDLRYFDDGGGEVREPAREEEHSND